MENKEKFWIVELTGEQLAILQRAAVEYCEGYRGSVFSKESLKETLELVYFPKHRNL
jgi:hypothetical protein